MFPSLSVDDFSPHIFSFVNYTILKFGRMSGNGEISLDFNVFLRFLFIKKKRHGELNKGDGSNTSTGSDPEVKVQRRQRSVRLLTSSKPTSQQHNTKQRGLWWTNQICASMHSCCCVSELITETERRIISAVRT